MVDSVDKIFKYIPTKSGAQAASFKFGFQKSQARLKSASGQVQSSAWLGSFWPGLRPKPALHYSVGMGAGFSGKPQGCS